MVVSYLSRYFRTKGYETAHAFNGQSGLALAEEFSPDVVLLDLKLPDCDGIEVLATLKKLIPGVGVIMVTGHGDVDTAVTAMRTHADHFVLKPLDLEVLDSIVQRVIQTYRQGEELSYLRGRLEAVGGGAISVMLPEAIANQIKLLGQSNVTTVLIQGETGTGKGVVARLIHELSPRGEGGFVDINCAGLASSLLESELFGYEQGAFTGAVARKRGLVELASGGSLFLDEIGDMPSEVQAKLLKVLEERTFRRMGGTQSLHVDVRLIAATNIDLLVATKQGRFRQDLYYRLSVVPLYLPPLRERIASIPGLANQFVREFARTFGKSEIRLSSEAERVLCEYGWPGNVRELRNAIERAVLLCAEPEILPKHLPEGLKIQRKRLIQDVAGLKTLASIEEQHIREVLAAVENNRSRAAEVLGVHRATLITKIKKYGID